MNKSLHPLPAVKDDPPGMQFLDGTGSMPCRRLDEPFVEMFARPCYKLLLKLLLKICSGVAQNLPSEWHARGNEVNRIRSNHVKVAQFSLTIVQGCSGQGWDILPSQMPLPTRQLQWKSGFPCCRFSIRTEEADLESGKNTAIGES